MGDPIGLLGGLNSYIYVRGSPILLMDQSGLYTAVVVNGPTSGNPFGHAAIAVSGSGAYSFGNTTPLGSSFTDYLAREAPRRDTEIRIIPTTPEQEDKILDYLRKQKDDVGYFDNCAVRTHNALRAGGVYLRDPYATPGFPEGVRRGMNNMPGTTVTIPRFGTVPNELSDFNQKR